MSTTDEYQEYTNLQKVILRILYGIGLILYTINILFAIHNIAKYLVRRKIGGRLIKLFYLLVIVINVALFSQFTILLIKPQYCEYMVKITGEKSYVAVIELVISCSMFMIGTLILVKMYQLSISIRQFLSLLTPKTAQIRKYTIFAVSTVCNVLYATLTIFWMSRNKPKMLCIKCLTFYGLLSVCYSLIIIHLQRTLKKIKILVQKTRREVLI